MNKKGFTLVELMIAVAIIGILAAVAIPSFMRFIRKSKTSELPINIKAIANGAVAWFQADHNDTAGNPIDPHFPWSGSPYAYTTTNDTTRRPSDLPCANGNPMYAKNSQNWQIQPFLALNFSINKAHYYQYRFQTRYSNAQAWFWAAGVSDLDCDGNKGYYYINAQVRDTSLEVETSELTRSQIVSGFDDPDETL